MLESHWLFYIACSSHFTEIRYLHGKRSWPLESEKHGFELCLSYYYFQCNGGQASLSLSFLTCAVGSIRLQNCNEEDHACNSSSSRLWLIVNPQWGAEKALAIHSSTLAWRIPGMGEPGGLPSIGSHRVGYDWSDLAVAVYWQDYMPGIVLISAWNVPTLEKFSPVLKTS